MYITLYIYIYLQRAQNQKTRNYSRVKIHTVVTRKHQNSKTLNPTIFTAQIINIMNLSM